ncbi:MAG TPA: PepSY-associated TM helix domain-containing protein [Stenotrophomonas sp.]|nr:PepSY-associated TM helix domain-containing protein [Stenotrophomonas sp.]
MKQGFRQSMAWLHTWTGLLVGWVLLLIFMGGTSAYYKEEISRWMRPELPITQVDAATALDSAERYLRHNAPHATGWNITLPDVRSQVISMYWINAPAAEGAPALPPYGEATVGPRSGKAVAARETKGGEFLYRLHFDLHYLPAIWARYIVGFCAMFMLVAIITGIITHKKIFKDFFTFRPGKGQRSWLDFHNASAVLALPFHAMITYTGLVTLVFMYLPWGINARYPQHPERYYEEAANRIADTRTAAGTPATMLPLATLLTKAQAQWPGVEVNRVAVSNVDDANAGVVFIARESSVSSNVPSLRFDGISGQLLERSQPPGAATRTYGTLFGLHIAHFADPALRLLFFTCGLLGCLMVASGAVLWAAKERPKHLKSGRIGFGLRLVDSLNIGAIAGLPIAFAAYFWGNRLLPVGLEGRANLEANVFFWAWSAALLAAFVWPKRAMWAWQLYVAAALFAGIPLLNALTTGIHLGVTIPAGLWSLAGVDLVCLGLGLCLAVAARRMQRWQPPLPASQRKAKPAQAPMVVQRAAQTVAQPAAAGEHA